MPGHAVQRPLQKGHAIAELGRQLRRQGEEARRVCQMCKLAAQTKDKEDVPEYGLRLLRPAIVESLPATRMPCDAGGIDKHGWRYLVVEE